jgi:pantoate--beta-alanine ligase
MVKQLNLPITMVLANTVRAEDGLALSSRNGYLSADERAEAPQLFAALSKMKNEIIAGRRDFSAMEIAAMAALTARGWQPDYITVRRSEDLLEPATNDRGLVILAAARLGKTRLIDNLELVVES